MPNSNPNDENNSNPNDGNYNDLDAEWESGENVAATADDEVISEVIEVIELSPELPAVSDWSEMDLSQDLHVPGKGLLDNSSAQEVPDACTGEAHVVMNFDVSTMISAQAICDPPDTPPIQEPHDLDEGELVDSSSRHVVLAYFREYINTLDNRVGMPPETEWISDGSHKRTYPYLHEKGRNLLIDSSVLDEFEKRAAQTSESGGLACEETHEECIDEGFTASDDSKFSNEETSSELDDSDVKVVGRRIVDFNYVWEQLHEKFDHHGGVECSISSIKLQKYVNRGLRTLLYFRCQSCDYVSSIWTDRNSDSIMGVNESAV